MAKKRDNTLLWVAGAGVIGWILAPKELKDKFLTGGAGGVSLDFSGLLGGGIDLGDLIKNLTPELPSLPEVWPDFPGWPTLPEWWPGEPDYPYVAPPSDVAPPSGTDDEGGTGDTALPPSGPAEDTAVWPVDITSPAVLQDFLGRTLLLGGRQYLSTALIGKHLVRPLPFAKTLKTATAPLRGAAKILGGKSIFETVAPRAFTEIAKHPATGETVLRLTAKGVGKKLGVKLGGKLVVKGVTGVAARAVPFAGWALLLVDLGADVARFFGADVTEWLGFSALAEPFLGYNPLEEWTRTKPALAAGGIGPTQAEGDFTPLQPMIQPESITRADTSRTPKKRTFAYRGPPGGIVQGYEPPDVTMVSLSKSERENLMGF